MRGAEALAHRGDTADLEICDTRKQQIMRANIASAPAETWNQKNLPSDIERFEESPGETMATIKELPSAAVGLVRRNRGTVMVVLAVAAVAGLAWYLATPD